VSESFARRHGIREGGLIELPSPGGLRAFRVAGVHVDYTRDQGVILIDRGNYAAHWPPPGVHSAAVHLRDPSQADAVADALRARFGRDAEYAVYSNASLRRRILEIFDQTFAVTHVLRTISVIVAVLGVSLTLTTLVTEREREIGILRAVGASSRQVRHAFVAESALVGLLAGFTGIAAGACLAVVLTHVINLAFFGWTVQLRYPWDVLAWTPLWIMAAAAAAGLLPAARAAKVEPAAALRSE
jgi:putative ABC transport system permease protein